MRSMSTDVCSDRLMNHYIRRGPFRPFPCLQFAFCRQNVSLQAVSIIRSRRHHLGFQVHKTTGSLQNELDCWAHTPETNPRTIALPVLSRRHRYPREKLRVIRTRCVVKTRPRELVVSRRQFHPFREIGSHSGDEAAARTGVICASGGVLNVQNT